MPQKGHSPLTLLALPQFHSSFKDLLSVRVDITDFDRNLIEAIFEMVMWFGRPKHDYDNFEKSARAAYYFLEKGNQVKPKDIAQRFYAVINKVTPAINSAIFAHKEAEQVPKNDTDSRILRYLEYYKVMYEGLIPFICAPIVYAFGISKNIKERVFIPGDDGKVDLEAIKKMERWLVYPENRLAIGLNGHIRNAYAHQNYKLLDNAQVELWDPNPYKPKRSWGPEIWQLDELIKLCDQLWINALGIICALVLYHVNNRQTLQDRGWIPPVQPPKLRDEELRSAIDKVAGEVGFYLKSVDSLRGNISMTLSIKPKGIDQDSELKLGSENKVSLFKIPLWYEEKRVIDQIIIMLHQIMLYFEPVTEVSIRVTSLDNTLLGVLTTDFQTIINLRLANLEPRTVNNIRNIFKVDTLKDYTTFVEKKGTPKYIGAVAVKPKS